MKEYKLTINGNEYAVTIVNFDDSIADIEVNGTPYKVEVERSGKQKSTISRISRPTPVAAAAPAAPAAAAGDGVAVTSPLPGVILEISVKEGDSVKRGDKLLVLEAMKMENVIEATTDGTVASIKVNQGDSVLEGAPLIMIG